jgi:hypothetical protein
MPKTIALQSINQNLVNLLQQQGYTVMDMYQAHRQRELVDAYLYTTYHPDALTTYYSVAELCDRASANMEDSSPSLTTLILNITDLPPEQVLAALERRLQHEED